MTDSTDSTLPPEGSGDRVVPVEIQTEMQRSYIDYAMSVIVGRALPDVRDGLKPVHRRVIYTMYDGGYRPDRSFNKSARVVGDVMGHYHPHGDSAIYDALVRLIQDWVQRYKGLGEMDYKELWDTTMNPDTRTLLQVTLEDAAAVDSVFSTLMGEDVELRRSFIQRNAKDVRFLDI